MEVEETEQGGGKAESSRVSRSSRRSVVDEEEEEEEDDEVVVILLQMYSAPQRTSRDDLVSAQLSFGLRSWLFLGGEVEEDEAGCPASCSADWCCTPESVIRQASIAVNEINIQRIFYIQRIVRVDVLCLTEYAARVLLVHGRAHCKGHPTQCCLQNTNYSHQSQILFSIERSDASYMHTEYKN